jgi:hypothetical protein
MAATPTQRPALALAIVRIAVGAALLWEARRLHQLGIGPWIVEDTAFRLVEAPSWYSDGVGRVALRFPTFFSWLVFGGLAAAGTSYFVGALVRPASAGILVLMLNVMLAGPPARRDYAALIAACAAACFVGDAGRRLGLDASLPERFTWRRRAAASKR